MRKFIKIIVVLTVLSFLLTGFSGAVEISKKVKIDEPEEQKEIVEEIDYTLYRFSPDGEITPVDVKILLESEDDLWKVLEEKCDELFESDPVIQEYLDSLFWDINNSDDNETDSNFTKLKKRFCRVKSRGRGFHFKTKTHVSILLKFKWFKLGLPKFLVYPRKPLVWCRYKNDSRAKTVVTPLLDTNSSVEINGSHSVIARNLVGYATWSGRFCFSPFNLLPRAFSGIATKVKVRRI